MHRIDSTTAEADKFGAGKDGWTEGEPGVTAPTQGTEDWFDAVQEEISGVVEGMGETLNKSDHGQLWAIHKNLLATLTCGNWVQRDNPTNGSLSGIAWGAGAGCFVAVGANSGTGNNYIARSPTGTMWYDHSDSLLTGVLYSVAWSESLALFVAVGAASGGDANITTAPDGMTWNERSNPKAFALHGVVWAEGLSQFIAVGGADGTDAYIVTSANGTSGWAEQSNPKNVKLNSVAWSESLGVAVAVGEADGGDAYIVTSTDGSTWTERSNPKNYALYAVAWSEALGMFIAVGDADVGLGTPAPYLITSTNGTSWSQVTAPIPTTKLVDGYGVVAVDELGAVVIVGNPSNTNGVGAIYTTDGSTWVPIAMPYPDDLNAVAWSPELGCMAAAGADIGALANLATSLVVPVPA